MPSLDVSESLIESCSFSDSNSSIYMTTVADESDVGNASVRSTHSTTANLHPFAPNLSVIQLKLRSYEAAVHAG